MKGFIAIAAIAAVAAALAFGGSAKAATDFTFDNGYNTRQVIKFGNMHAFVDIRSSIRRYTDSPRAPGPLQAGGLGRVGSNVEVMGGGIGRVGNNVRTDTDAQAPARSR